METKSYAVDAIGNKIYKGDKVAFESGIYFVEDFQYLQRSYDTQYLTLKDTKNERKILSYVDSKNVLKNYGRT